MSTSRLGEHLFDIPIGNIACVGLIESYLQLPPQVLVEHLGEIVLRAEKVNAMRLVIFDFNGIARVGTQRLPLFVGEFGNHGALQFCRSIGRLLGMIADQARFFRDCPVAFTGQKCRGPRQPISASSAFQFSGDKKKRRDKVPLCVQQYLAAPLQPPRDG